MVSMRGEMPEYAVKHLCFLKWSAKQVVNKRISKTRHFLKTVFDECKECKCSRSILNTNLPTEIKKHISEYYVICENCCRIHKALKQRHIMPLNCNDKNPNFMESYLLSMLIKFPEYEEIKEVVKEQFPICTLGEYEQMKTYFYNVFLRPKRVQKILGGVLKEVAFKKVVESLTEKDLITTKRLPMKLDSIKWFLDGACAPERWNDDYTEWSDYDSDNDLNYDETW